jgi:hypothetical protein
MLIRGLLKGLPQILKANRSDVQVTWEAQGATRSTSCGVCQIYSLDEFILDFQAATALIVEIHLSTFNIQMIYLS